MLLNKSTRNLVELVRMIYNAFVGIFLTEKEKMEPDSCKDELPYDWIPTAKYQAGVGCTAVNCETLADHKDCFMNFSSEPLTNCVNSTTGLVRDFCKHSCKSCGMN